MNIIQNWHLRSNDLSSSTDRRLELYLYHAARLEASTLGHAMDQCLVEINDQCLLVRAYGGRAWTRIRRLAPRYQGSRGLRCAWELGYLLRGCSHRASGRLQGGGSLLRRDVTRIAFGGLCLLCCFPLSQRILVVQLDSYGSLCRGNFVSSR